LKETRPLWPPQRGVGLQEPNLGKTNPRVTLFICLRFVLRPLSRTHFFITNANPACSCVHICKFQFRPIHPPSRRLSSSAGNSFSLRASSIPAHSTIVSIFKSYSVKHPVQPSFRPSAEGCCWDHASSPKVLQKETASAEAART
jgi:hypothetical protein